MKKPVKQKSDVKSYDYHALKHHQRKGAPQLEFVLFHAPAREIYEWARVVRMSPNDTKGIQRPLKLAKAKKVQKFLEARDDNTIASAVIIAFDKKAVTFSGTLDAPGKKSQHGTIKIDGSATSPAGIIVDGQHRVTGCRTLEDDIHLNVVGLLGADEDEGAFQFIVINNTASKVAANHVKALFANYNETGLNDRLLESGGSGLDDSALNAIQIFDRSEASPFAHLIKWERNSAGFIAINALEAAYEDVRERSSLLSIKEVELDTFLTIWGTVKNEWPHLWNRESHLLEKVSIQALTAHVCDSLELLSSMSDEALDYTDPDVLTKQVGKAISMISPRFFEVQWAMTELDTRRGLEIVRASLRVISSNTKNKRPWHVSVEMINPASLSDTPTKKAARPRKIVTKSTAKNPVAKKPATKKSATKMSITKKSA